MSASRNDNVLWFEEGIIGVPRARRFQLLEDPSSPVRVLSCLDIEGFSLPVVDPRLVDADYAPRLAPRVADVLALEPADPVLLLVVTTSRSDGAVANLRAPLVVNVRRRLAAQIILEDRAHPLRAPFSLAGVGESERCAASE